MGSRGECKRCKKMNDDCVEAGGSWSWSGRGVGLTSTHYHWTGPLHLEDSTASVKQVKLATARNRGDGEYSLTAGLGHRMLFCSAQKISTRDVQPMQCGRRHAVGS